ncbi:alpha/beta fold hydrolase [Georgenia sp. M64]|uniref:alpha/beta hydrolase family protein n=1 Tax=Georgenia sp. M64 TaxID=3120520 RepID=UPI0030E54763
MAEVSINTPRGVHLAGTFEPAGGHAAVLFVHGFLADRHSSTRFDRLAAAYRAAGYATLQVDLSGCGASDDDVVTVAGEVEDIRSASAWLAEEGYPVQAVHAHSFGTFAAMRAAAPHVVTMVLTGAMTGPMSYPWEEIFSPGQLDDLERLGHARIPDDNVAAAREYSVISRQTLADFSLIDQAELLGSVKVPVLLVHGDHTEEASDQVVITREGLHLLPAGSRLELLAGAEPGVGDRMDEVARLALDWFAVHLPAG